MAGIDGTVLVALITGVCTLTATVTGVIVKGRYDNRQHARDLAARSDERWQDLRLARCAALLDALTRARAELAELAANDSNDPEGRAARKTFATARPEYLVNATRDVALIASRPVVVKATAAVRIGWDALASAYDQELLTRPVGLMLEDGFEATDEDAVFRADVRRELRRAVRAAERAEDELREVMRHHLTDIGG